MTLTMAPIRYIRDLFAPTLLSWPICLSNDLMLIITPLEQNKLKLYHDQYRRAWPPRWERVGTKPPAATTFTRGLLRNQRFSISRKIRRYIRERRRIYGIQYVKVDIRTNKPLNAHFRFRLSCGYATGTDHRLVYQTILVSKKQNERIFVYM